MDFSSERINYRKFTKEDFNLFYLIFSNEQIMRYAWIDKFDREEEAYALFENFLNVNDKLSKNNTFTFACFSASDDKFIGFADIELLISNSKTGCGEIGYFLMQDYWGKGYASEIAKAMIKFGFIELKLHKISARCNANNLKSEAVMKKAGMIKEAEFRKVRYKYGVWDDEKHYGILVEDWKA